MLISVHVLVLNSTRPLLRWASVSLNNGASSLAYCGCVGIGCARRETVSFGPGPSVDCEMPGQAASATKRTARTPIAIRRMGASFVSEGGTPGWWSGSLCFAVHDVNGARSPANPYRRAQLSQRIFRLLVSARGSLRKCAVASGY